jgi:hypothetical protein
MLFSQVYDETVFRNSNADSKMKNDLAGIFFHMEQASPEAMRAQRMAELKNLAEWRQRHLKELIEWSDPVKREAKKAQYAADEAAGREKLKDIPAEFVAVRTGFNIAPVGWMVKLIHKPLPKLSWWRKLKHWLGFR